MGADAAIHQGDDVTFQITVYSDEAETTVLDLTGYSVLGYRVGWINSDKTLLELTEAANGNGSVVQFGTPRSNGVVNVTLAAADTQGLKARQYAHQLILTDDSSNDQVVTDGSLTVKETLPAAS